MHGNLGMRTGRKRNAVVRVNGAGSRAKVVREDAPTQVRRLREAALAGMADAQWGTELGRLNLTGQISDAMYAAGKKWAELAAKYHGSIGVFPVRSTTGEMGRGSSPPDPDSDEGQRVAKREREGAERFFEADKILVDCGPGVRIAVRRLCEDNEAPCLFDELVHVRFGLMSLVSHWDLTGGGKSDRRKNAG